MKYCWYVLLILLHSAHAANHPVQVGDSTVIIQTDQHGQGKAFVHLHQNETTALTAAKEIIKAEGGSLLTLIHNGERNIVFHLQGQRYEFDPNRIFTDAGIKKTLTQFGGYTPAALNEVNKLAAKLKMLLPKGKIIAVHNNRQYSLKNYLPGHDMAHDAQVLHIHDQVNHRNFYLVTRHHDYIRLNDLKFNSVLQSKNATDDGSLSVYLAGRDYVNVEAGYDQLLAQINMLKYA